MATHRSKHNGHHRSHYDLVNDMDKIKAAIFDTTQDLKGRAGEMLVDSVVSMKNQSNHLKEGVADYASERPFKALGIALATGIALGLLIKRR